MEYLRKRLGIDNNFLKIGRYDCISEISKYFDNSSTIFRKLESGILYEICTPYAVYKIERTVNDNMYKLIVEIDLPLDVDKKEIKKILETYEGWWSGDKILVRDKFLNKIRGGYEFEFAGLIAPDGEEIKIWR